MGKCKELDEIIFLHRVRINAGSRTKRADTMERSIL